MNRFALFRAPSDGQHLDVPHAGRTYRVALKRHATARRMSIRVKGATGEVVMTVPTKVDITRAFAFAVDQGSWIASRVAALPERVAFLPGAVVPFRGVPHRIVKWTEAEAPVVTATDSDGLKVIAVGGSNASIPAAVKEFLSSRALADLEESVDHYAAKLGVEVASIKLKDTKSRWGSCSSRGNVNFSWRLALTPGYVLDYLAAHEVAHLRHMDHSPRYWSLLRKACPATDDAETWLKRHGASLHRYG